MISPLLFIDSTLGKGRGVFASDIILAEVIIEVAPVIVMTKEDRTLLDKTLLHDYIFEWGELKDQCAMALGFVPIYNHSSNSNAEYFMDFAQEQIMVKTVRMIAAGEEVTINYNGDWDDENPVWFDVK